MERVKTKVSIVVPVYNTAKYLKKCLQSLKDQSLRDIEIICVNDGSTDNSKEIIDQFVAEDFRFRAIHKNNTGYGHSVNVGIRAAQSPYIGILESDDFAELNMYQRLYEVAEKNSVDLVKANYNLYNETTSNRIVFEEMLGAFPYEKVLSIKDNHKVFGTHPSVWSALYRKEFLKNNDIWFLETPGASYQDISFGFKVYVNAERFCFIREAVLNYRIDNVDSSVHNPQKIFCVCDEMKEMERYIHVRAEAGKINTEWKEKLYKIASWLKYRNYMWNYLRLSLPYQYTFLMKILDELNVIRQQGCEAEVWEDEEKRTLNSMLENPDAFFKATSKGYEEPRLSLIPVLNHTFSVRCFYELVKECCEIYVYGAGRIGMRVWQCLKKIGAGNKVKGFVVSQDEDNPESIEDKKVFLLSEIQEQENKDALMIVAVHRQYQYEISLVLQAGGYSNILLIDEKMKSWIYEETDR